MKTLHLQTRAEEMADITAQVQAAVDESGVAEGLCCVYCPHTTAALTINENADPDVARDILYALGQSFPPHAAFRHFEGNSAAHVKASVLGAAVTVPVQAGRLGLGRWQGIFFCEFDGPRTRQYTVTVLGTAQNAQPAP
ncbi:secondary thiamine-phosphate synthase enzyme YjbQ [Ruminococcaceae bacterium OttesenSCG-928-O06]|nr:secondary thiamine-phosphate synthase enzyme YjbQ [Ruminococcaceae bacterium OttesenSCG-928-O06]